MCHVPVCNYIQSLPNHIIQPTTTDATPSLDSSPYPWLHKQGSAIMKTPNEARGKVATRGLQIYQTRGIQIPDKAEEERRDGVRSVWLYVNK